MTTRTSSLVFCLALLSGRARADSLYVRLVGQLDMPQTAHSVDAARDLVYIANVDTLRVASVADPTHPVEIGHLGALDFARGVAEIGGYVYVADCDASLRIISVADPAHPVEVGRCPIPDRGASIVVSGDYAFVGHLSGVRVMSIVDPAHPTEVAHCQTGYPNDLDVSGSHLYVADGALRIISVADPTNPTEVGYHSVPGSINAVAVSGEFAYTASTDSAFRVISVVDPAHPTEVGRCRYRSNWEGPAPQDLGVSRGHAFLADWHGGLRIIDVADPASPKEVGHYDLGTSWSVSLNGDYVYFTADTSLVILQFYQLGDLDIDNDSLDVTLDTLRLLDWTLAPGDPLECVSGECLLANTSAIFNPDTVDGPSVSPVDSLRVTGSLTGPGGTIDSIVIPNLPAMLAQGQTMVCTLAAYVPLGLRDGDYTGSIIISGKDTADLEVDESCYVRLSKLGDLDVDNDSLSVIVDTMRLTNAGSEAIGEFILANTSESYNPDSADGPSLSPVDSLSFTGSLTGQSGTIDSIIIPSLPQTLARGQAIVCTLAVYVPPELRDGDYAGSITITGKDSVGAPIQETFSALVRNVLGDLDVDGDTLDVVLDTMNVRAQPGYLPSGTARFMVVNTTSTYNPDTADGPSRSPLRQVEVKAKVEAEDGAVDSVYVLNLPESLAVGQAVECTLALVIPVGESLDSYFGTVTISAYDTAGYQVRDSFFLEVRSTEPHQDFDSFRVVPIPFKPNQNPEHDAIHFQGLTAGARVTAYDASGQSVWSATESGDGHLAWKAEVASGIYVYLVVSADGKASKVGKLSVIR